MPKAEELQNVDITPPPEPEEENDDDLFDFGFRCVHALWSVW